MIAKAVVGGPTIEPSFEDGGCGAGLASVGDVTEVVGGIRDGGCELMRSKEAGPSAVQELVKVVLVDLW